MTDEDLDHRPLGKGRYAAKTASEVAQLDPQYLCWAYENWTPKPCSKLLYDDCQEELRQERVAKDHRRW